MSDYCFVEFGGFGDAIITKMLVELVLADSPSHQIWLVVSQKATPIYCDSNNKINILFEWQGPLPNDISSLKMGVFHIPQLMKEIRARKFDNVLSFRADLREELIVLASKATEKINVRRSNLPAIQKRSRLPMLPNCCFDTTVHIPLLQSNVYDECVYVAQKITGNNSLQLPTFQSDKIAINRNAKCQKMTVALHPFASQNYKLWNDASWIELALKLHSYGINVFVFCSSNENARASNLFRSILGKVHIVASDLSNFFVVLREASLLIGLDSFSVHAANYLGVPSILIGGGNDNKEWKPPSTQLISNGHRYKCHPCYNDPSCSDSSDAFGCIRSISVEQVLQKAFEVLGR